MKRLLVVALLLALMVGVEASTPPVAGAASSPLTLAAIGFVVLAAFSVAEGLAAVGLPRVSGYLLSGAVLGPQLANVLNRTVVTDLRMFNTLAVGLIAVGAGLELDLKQVGKLWRTLLATIGFKLAIVAPVFGATLLGGLWLLRPFPALAFGGALAIATLLGVLATSTSPAITLAIITEGKAKGRLTELTLANAVFKDVVVVTGMALAVAVGRTLVDAHSHFEAEVLLHTAVEIGASIVAGVVLGGLMILYLRFVAQELLLFVAVAVLLGAEVSTRLHLEFLLLFIVAGATVRNGSHYAHDVEEPLSLVSLPVFIVFFTNVGAQIDLVKLLALLPIAGTLFAVRAGALRVAGSLGARAGGESAALGANAFLAYIPQAGIELGLVATAAEALPAIGAELRALGTAVIALNLLIGPITQRLAFRRVGELGGGVAVENEAPSNEATAEPLSPDLDAALAEFTRKWRTSITELAAGAPALPPLPSATDAETLGDGELEGAITRRVAALAALAATAAETTPSLVSHFPLELAGARPRGWWAPRWGRRSAPLLARTIARRTLELQAPFVERRLMESLVRAEWVALSRDERADAAAEITAALARELAVFEAELVRTLASGAVPLGEPTSPSIGAQTAGWVEALRGAHGLARTRALLGRVQARATVLMAFDSAALERIEAELASLFAEVEASLESQRTAPRAEALTALEARVVARVAELAELLRQACPRRRGSGALARELSGVLPVHLAVSHALSSDRAAPIDGRLRLVPLRQIVQEELFDAAIPRVDAAVREVVSATVATVAGLAKALGAVTAGASRDAESAVERALFRSRELERKLRDELVTIRDLATHWLSDAMARIEARSLHDESTLQQLLHAPSPLDALGAQVSAFGQQLDTTRRQLRAQLEAFARRGLRLAPPSTGLESLRALVGGVSAPSLPKDWLEAFAPEPLSDPRKLAGRRALLDQLVARAGAAPRAQGMTALVVGPFGAGRTTLVNMLEHALDLPRVLRLDRALYPRTFTLQEAIAAELGCAPTRVALAQALTSQPTAVLVDDLERWFAPSPHGASELERWLELVAGSRARVYWVATTHPAWLARAQELLPIVEALGAPLELAPLTPAEIGALVRARQLPTRRELTLEEPAGALRFFRRILGMSQEQAYFRLLAAASGGLPARVVALCRSLARAHGTHIELSLPSLTAAPPARLDALSSDALVLLAAVLEHGELGREELAELLALSPSEVRLHAAQLVDVGVLEERVERHSWEVAASARPIISDALGGLGG